MEAKETRLGSILCHLDYLAGILLEKTDHDVEILLPILPELSGKCQAVALEKQLQLVLMGSLPA